MEARSLFVKSFEVRPFTDFEQGGGVFMCPYLVCTNRNVDLVQPSLIISVESTGDILDTYRLHRFLLYNFIFVECRHQHKTFIKL